MRKYEILLENHDSLYINLKNDSEAIDEFHNRDTGEYSVSELYEIDEYYNRLRQLY